jgi:hypothetical protein
MTHLPAHAHFPRILPLRAPRGIKTSPVLAWR